MPLAFTDTNGNEGRISDDLTVTHAAENGIVGAIEARIREIEADAAPGEDVLSRLMFVLVGEYEIREIRRIGDGPRELR